MEEEQHQIPQQISSYQFRLVGDMTLQQFFQVAAGAIIALLLYSSGLPGYIKWPLVLLSFLTGVAFAFFPLEDRPLQKWVLLFFKAIYSPTLFVWKQNPNIPDYFQKEEVSLPQAQTTPAPTKASTPPATSDPAAAPLPELEKKEQELLSRIDKTIQEPIKAQVQTQAQDVKPEAKPEQKKKIEVPKTEQIEVEKPEAKPVPETPAEPEQSTGSDITPIASQPSIDKAKQAQFNQDSGPPMPPNKPNVVVGQVLGPEGEIVENAILEIKDAEGRPVRALKTNKLGHFMIVTSLSNGEYEIITEKEGLDFDTIRFEAKGDVIPPIAIWANKSQDNTDKKENATKSKPQDQQQESTEKTIYNQGGQQ